MFNEEHTQHFVTPLPAAHHFHHLEAGSRLSERMLTASLLMYRKDTSLILTWYVEIYVENTRVHVLLYSARHLVIKRRGRKMFWRWTKQALNNIILVYTE